MSVVIRYGGSDQKTQTRKTDDQSQVPGNNQKAKMIGEGSLASLVGEMGERCMPFEHKLR